MNIAYLASCVTPAVRERRAIRSYSPAGSRKALLFARVLQELGHRVTVLSSSYGYTGDGEFAEDHEGVPILHSPNRVWFGKHRPFKRTLAGWFNLCTLFRLRHQLDLVVIYNFEPEFALPALLARAWFGRPFVLDFEDGIFLDRGYRGLWRRFLERCVYTRMAGAILVNAGLAARIQGRVGAGTVPTVVVHGFLNRDWREQAGASPRQETGPILRLLCAGNLSADFGFAELQRYIDALPESVHLTISGRIDPPEEAELRARVAHRANREFCGFVSAAEHERLLRQADGVILLHNPESPYNATNFPSKFFDYLSRGKRILSTRNPLFEPYAHLPNLLFVTLTPDGLKDIGDRLRQCRPDVAALAALDRTTMTELGAFLDGVERSHLSRTGEGKSVPTLDRDRVASLVWHTRGSLPAELTEWLAGGLSQAVAVKANPKRTVWSLPIPGGQAFAQVYLKHDHPQALRDCLKRLWRCKAEVEYQAGVRLADAGVPCVPVLGWAQCGRDSFLLSAEIPTARLFWEVWRDCARVPERRRRFLGSLVAFERRLLTAGVRHPDLHVGNVLVQETSHECRFFLVDLYGVQLAARRSALVPRSLLWLTCVLGELTWAEASVFLAGCGVGPGARDGFWRDLWNERALDTAYRWRSHCRRFSRCSSLCDESVDTHGRWLRLAFFPAAAAVAAVCAHRAGIASGTGVVKQDRKRCLTRVLAATGSVIVKQFRAMPGGWPWRPDRLCWLNAHRLASYHIPTATALAWLRGTDRHGYVLFADLGTRTLYDALKAAVTGAERRRLLQDAGALVARLHLVGICHGDLKIHNFMIPSGPAGERQSPCLVDVDRVYFHPLRGEAYRRRNLEQFAETLHQDFPELSLLPFMAAYRRFARLSRAELAGLWRHGPAPARQA